MTGKHDFKFREWPALCHLSSSNPEKMRGIYSVPTYLALSTDAGMDESLAGAVICT